MALQDNRRNCLGGLWLNPRSAEMSQLPVTMTLPQCLHHPRAQTSGGKEKSDVGVGKRQSNPCKKCRHHMGSLGDVTRGLGNVTSARLLAAALGEAGQRAGPGSQRLPEKSTIFR